VTVPAWFDDFTDGIAAGEGRYHVCPACDAAVLPPRRRCPDCGATELAERPLPDRGTIHSFTEISVTIPAFHGETPYTVVLVDLDGRLTLTGQLREAEAADVAIGDTVALGTDPRDDGAPLLTFTPTE
jgi:hypothetical protein